MYYLSGLGFEADECVDFMIIAFNISLIVYHEHVHYYIILYYITLYYIIIYYIILYYIILYYIISLCLRI